MQCSRENVCMTVSEEKNLYAVGSHSFVTLIDCRKRLSQPIATRQRDRGLFQGQSYLHIITLSITKFKEHEIISS